MYVSNKYDLGDEVYFINAKNEPCKAKIKNFHIHVLNKETVDIDYILDIDDRDVEDCYNEDELYSNEYDMKDEWMKDLIEFV